MAKQTFLMRKEWIRSVKKLKTDAQKARFLEAIFAIQNGEEVEVDDVIDMALEPMRGVWEEDDEKYKETTERNRINGSRGGRPRNPNNPVGFSKSEETQSEKDNPENPDYDYDYDINKKEKLKKEKEFVEKIYQAYPRKVAKPAALRAIANALDRRQLETGKRITPEVLLERTLSYAKAVSNWPKGDDAFCPNPATWFNQERYNDDPLTWQRKPKEGGGQAAQFDLKTLKMAYKWRHNFYDSMSNPTDDDFKIFRAESMEEFARRVGEEEINLIKEELANQYSAVSKFIKSKKGK